MNKGSLDSELMRIAYVGMTRPRRLLAVALPKVKNYILKKSSKSFSSKTNFELTLLYRYTNFLKPS
ncbi:hypothetical protein M5Z94_12730 [Oceanotoga teriensis]|nr:hypothetical protein [Oceanotoga teriensis]